MGGYGRYILGGEEEIRGECEVEEDGKHLS